MKKIILYLFIIGVSLLGVKNLFANKGKVLSENNSNRVVLPAAIWTKQSINNCAPEAVSMMLQYFGVSVSQEEVRKQLRTNSIDKNVFSYEISAYLKKYNIESIILYNGSLDKLKKLISGGFYVMVEDWMYPGQDIGHNTIIRGFDDNKKVLIADDPYRGGGVEYKYDDFDQKQWKAFNREYMPIYKMKDEDKLKKIIGEDWNSFVMYKNSEVTNTLAVMKDPLDMYSWFNLGTTYVGLGEYNRAKQAFEISRNLGWPKRMLWYQYQPIRAYNQLGEYKKALDLIKIGLVNNDSYPELHYEAAVSYKGLGDNRNAKSELSKTLMLSPNYQPAASLKI